MDAMNPHQETVTRRVLGEESAHRRHLVVHLSGAHAYGFASTDSDLDLKAIHVLPTEVLLGLATPQVVANRLEVVDGVEVDYTSNEIEVAIRGLIKGDGNMLERVTSVAPIECEPALAELRPLALAALSRRYHRHYRGFAASQRKAVEEGARVQAKRVLYVLRTALTGTHLLETGECVPDLTALCDDYGFDEAHPLIALKRGGERLPLPESLAASVPALLGRVFDRLDTALARSPLPEEPSDASVRELDAWLIATRKSRLTD